MPARLRLFALVFGLSVLGCGEEVVTESDCPDDGTKSEEGEQFASQYSVAYCDLRKDCYPDAFDAEFDGIESCQRAVSKREIKDDCDGCVLDQDVGNTCIETAKTISCSDWVDNGELEAACDARWDCSDAE